MFGRVPTSRRDITKLVVLGSDLRGIEPDRLSGDFVRVVNPEGLLPALRLRVSMLRHSAWQDYLEAGGC